MARGDWEYLPVKKDTRTVIEKLRAYLILHSGEKQTYDDTIRYLLQFLPEEIQTQVRW